MGKKKNPLSGFLSVEYSYSRNVGSSAWAEGENTPKGIQIIAALKCYSKIQEAILCPFLNPHRQVNELLFSHSGINECNKAGAVLPGERASVILMELDRGTHNPPLLPQLWWKKKNRGGVLPSQTRDTILTKVMWLNGSTALEMDNWANQRQRVKTVGWIWQILNWRCDVKRWAEVEGPNLDGRCTTTWCLHMAFQWYISNWYSRPLTDVWSVFTLGFWTVCWTKQGKIFHSWWYKLYLVF